MSDTTSRMPAETLAELPPVAPPPFNWKDTPYGKTGGPMELPTGAELHACLGLNSCKGQDRYGVHGPNGNNPNSCAGQGYCATTEIHSCHTNNNCANQGGCGLYGWGPDMDQPGQNECRSMGSCATPINAERFITDGDHKGMSVWGRARQVFEAAYAEKHAGKTPGQAPAPFRETGPTAHWITENCNSFAACGASGLSGGGSCS